MADLPEEIPILPVRDTVVYPGAIIPISVGREKSLRLLADLQDRPSSEERHVGIITQRNLEQEDVAPGDLYQFGTIAKVHHILRLPNETAKVIVQGMERIRLVECLQEEPYFRARVEIAPDLSVRDNQVEGLMRAVTQQLRRYMELIPGLPEDLLTLALNASDPNRLAYLIGFNTNLKLEERQSLLDVDHPYLKLGKLSLLLGHEIEIQELGQKIQSEVQENLGKSQRDYYLREQLRAIHKELGEDDDPQSEALLLRQRLEEAGLPEEARHEAERELSRLEKLPPGSAEHPVIRQYLDWMIQMPWHRATTDSGDINAARVVLDTDHYDLQDIKERLLEFLAVYKLKAERGETGLKGPILCLVGPPGVGKTSLGQSIARALGRKFTRMSVGGMRDESEIRGHRRTYIGAMPGRIIQAIGRCGANNPVFMLDEVDKLGSADFRGDPSSALLEVLDPEQNKEFRDHYLDVAWDLSQVMFIATANTLDPIPPALRDRMEILRLSGYSEEEKIQIALRHLVPKQLKEHCLTPEQLDFREDGIRKIVGDYTREAGVRSLEREIASICRKVARRLAEGEALRAVADASFVAQCLGKRRFFPEGMDALEPPGISHGLAWTETGGEVLPIETIRLRGNGQLRLTGHLGDVMKESAQAALSFLWSRADQLGLEEQLFRESDFHVHIPSGAVPKEGPSAGVAIAVALLSLITNRSIPPGMGFTGEITLRGKVLPVGGIKEKILAARRDGLKTVILPLSNQADLEEIPPEYIRDMRFILVQEVGEILAHVFPSSEKRIES